MRLFLLAWAVLAASCLPAQPERMFAPGIVSAPPPGSPMWRGPRGAMLADFTGDGNLDLVTGSGGTLSAGYLYLFPGDGAGNFAQPPVVTTLPVGTPELRPLHAADLNGDGIDDLLVYRDGGPTYGIVPFITMPGGVFQELAPLPGLLGSGALTAFADINGNGILDAVAVRLVSVNPWVLELQVLLNNGNATQWTPVAIENSALTGLYPKALAVGDFNGDGLMDIAYCTASPGVAEEIRFLLATGNLTYTNVSGGLAPGTGSPCAPCLPQSSAPLTVTWLRAGDLDGDGIDDLVAVGRVGLSTASGVVGRVWIWPGRAGGVPGPVEWSDPPRLRETSVQSEGPVLADLDLDGYPELVVTRAFQYTVWPGHPFADVLRLSPSDAPGARARYEMDALSGVLHVVPINAVWPPGASSPHWVTGQLAVGDVDNDGDLDIVEVWCDCALTSTGLLPSLPMVHTYLNQTVRRRACTVGGPTLGLVRGTPSINNPAYGIGLSGAPPGAGAALLASLGEDAITIGTCTVGIDLSPGLRLLPTASMGFVTADSSGSAFVPVPIPGDPSLIGLTVFAQWIAADPAGLFILGGISYSLSDVAQITIW